MIREVFHTKELLTSSTDTDASAFPAHHTSIGRHFYLSEVRLIKSRTTSTYVKTPTVDQRENIQTESRDDGPLCAQSVW